MTEIANALDIPILNETLKTTISDIVNKILVLPNRLVIPIVPDHLDQVELNNLRQPQPQVNIYFPSFVSVLKLIIIYREYFDYTYLELITLYELMLIFSVKENQIRTLKSTVVVTKNLKRRLFKII